MKVIKLLTHRVLRDEKTSNNRGIRPLRKSARDTAGALTVEAAVMLPVVLCAFFSVIFLIRVVYSYELIQHALSETASEMASTGYIYHISGIRDLHDTVRNSINDRSELFREQIGSVIEAYDSLRGAGTDGNSVSGTGGDYEKDSDGSLANDTGGNCENGTGVCSENVTADLSGTADKLVDIKEKFSNICDHSKNIISDPLDEIKTIVCYIAGGTFNDVKTQLYTPVVKLYMKKYLRTDSIPDVNERLTALGIVDGFDGLDFSESSFLSDAHEDIDIVVRYKVRLPIPVKFVSDLEFVQRVKAKAWMGGDESKGVLDGQTGGEDIWSLSNFQRGLKIRRKFGANLPDSFPVIARYENGRAVMIKSMDLTAASYQVPGNAEKTLKGYVNELVKYKGQNKPWGRDDILIRGDDIQQKELLLVIPENKVSESVDSMLSDMVRYAESRGVRLEIKKYGMKIIDNGTEGETNKTATQS